MSSNVTKTLMSCNTLDDDRLDNKLTITSLIQALDAGQVDVAVHWLQLMLLSKSGDKSVQFPWNRRLLILQKAVTQMVRDNQADDNTYPLRPGLAPRSVHSLSELSYSQLQMFALQRLQPSSTAYNVTRALLYTDIELNLSALKNTMDTLMAKHEALRTCFDVDIDAGGQARQVVHSLAHFQGQSGLFNVVTCDLVSRCDIENVSNDKQLAAFIAQTIDHPFDLAHQAPIRVYVFNDPSTLHWILVVVLHHIVTDAASSQLFWKDFHHFYAFFMANPDFKPPTANLLLQLENEASSASSLTYRDFAVWQRSRLRSCITAPLLQYWIEQLTKGGSVPVLLELPFDILRSEGIKRNEFIANGDVVVFQSSPTLQKAFSELCHAQGASMFMGLLAVFYLLIERLSGQQDFVIGAPFSGREATELENIMGYFVNTLPLRLGAKWTGNENFNEFLGSVREIVLNAYTHSEIPFHKVLEHVRASVLSRQREDTSDNERWQHPLFQIMFSWEQSDKSPPSNKYRELPLPHQSSKFDLMLSMRYRPFFSEKTTSTTERVLEGSMEYPTNRFSRPTVERFTRYYLKLLEQVTLYPTTLVRSPSLSMLCDFEREQLVVQWGMPKLSKDVQESERATINLLDECVFCQVEQTPHNVALHFENTQWTYQNLWKYSGDIQKTLYALDISNNSTQLHVGLLLDRGLENVAAMLGILRSKAVFVPLDPEFPRERLRFMARDSCLQVIITEPKHDAIATYLSRSTEDSEHDNFSPYILHYEDASRISSNLKDSTGNFESLSYDTPPSERDSLTTTAYILYTSGSTGNPKGVMVSHAALLTTLWWTVRTYAVSSSDVFLQSTSTTLDGSLSQLFSPLLVGGSARITRPNGLHNLSYMRTVLLEAPHVTFCVFVPSYFGLLMDYLRDHGDSFPPSIKHVVLAGEAFPIELAHQFYTNNKETTTCLVNEYGPTEASITSTAFHFPRQKQNLDIFSELQSVPIGKPIDEHPVVVLDTQKRLVPVNVPGELYIGGKGVAQGYWHRPELTKKVFIYHKNMPESVPQDSSMQWYKTGDLVKWLPSGDLVFLGRTDTQVKHHGMRIEPQEIRNFLLRHKSVKGAEILALPQQKCRNVENRPVTSKLTLVAFVMLIDDISDNPEVVHELRSYLLDHLPMHMVPQAIQIVQKWPRTPNGKIDLRELANCEKIDSSRIGGLKKEPNKETTGTVQLAIDILRQVWIQVLGMDHFDNDEDGEILEKQIMTNSFFELGGDSLTAIRAIALAKARGLHNLTLDHFFRSSSLSEMAKSAATSIVDLRMWALEIFVPLNFSRSRSATSLPTLFLFHDADGTVWKLLELARQLPFPVIGVQAFSYQDDKTDSKPDSEASSIEQLAKFYWKNIRQRQKVGPYAFGGFSFGCRIAHEVARLAVNEGQTMLPLILLDGLPFKMPLLMNKAQNVAAQLQIEKFAAEEFNDSVLQPLQANYRNFCLMDEKYQPYPVLQVKAASSKPKPPIWLSADLYMTQHWQVDISRYRSLGIDIKTVMTIPDCTHLTMLRHPTVKPISRHIRQRFQVLVDNLDK